MADDAEESEPFAIYRSFVFGDLAELVLTDERLYRDGPPCGLASTSRMITAGCADRLNPARTMLGAEQREWFLERVKGSTRTWKLWGNEVMVMQLKLLSLYTGLLFEDPPPGDLFFNLDQWDGFPAERARILSELRDAGVRNLVTLTGDIHTFFAGYQKVNFDAFLEPPVAVCFVCGSITSSNLVELATFGAGGLPVPPIADLAPVAMISNPHIVYLNSSGHGYNLLEITPSELVCTMKAVDTIRMPSAGLITLKRFRVPRDQVVIEDVTGLPI